MNWKKLHLRTCHCHDMDLFIYLFIFCDSWRRTADRAALKPLPLVSHLNFITQKDTGWCFAPAGSVFLPSGSSSTEGIWLIFLCNVKKRNDSIYLSSGSVSFPGWSSSVNPHFIALSLLRWQTMLVIWVHNSEVVIRAAANKKKIRS